MIVKKGISKQKTRTKASDVKHNPTPKKTVEERNSSRIINFNSFLFRSNAMCTRIGLFMLFYDC